MIDPIEALADCIMRFEGWLPPGSMNPKGSVSWRNRNPGNLRPYSKDQPVDESNYRMFQNLDVGWTILRIDLQTKIEGKSIHNLTPDSTLTDLFNIYAPAKDKNNPWQYSNQVAQWLSKIYNTQVTPTTKLSEIMKLGS